MCVCVKLTPIGRFVAFKFWITAVIMAFVCHNCEKIAMIKAQNHYIHASKEIKADKDTITEKNKLNTERLMEQCKRW